jgi:hydrogenase nickel incorporation protein HypA/HybF
MAIAVELMEQLERLADEHAVVRFESVRVQAGVLRGIVPEALDMAFKAASEGTRAEGAALELEILPAAVRCRRCDLRFEPEPDSYLCERCGRADVELLGGNEILLRNVTCQQEPGASSDEEH